MRVALGDVRRVGDDEIEALLTQRVEPAAMAPLNVEAEGDAVAFRDHERRGAGFYSDDAGARPMLLDGERDGAAAGAEVEHAGEIALEREVDQQLRLGSRDEHRGAHRERQAVELLAAEDKGNRLAAAPARG